MNQPTVRDRSGPSPSSRRPCPSASTTSSRAPGATSAAAAESAASRTWSVRCSGASASRRSVSSGPRRTTCSRAVATVSRCGSSGREASVAAGPAWTSSQAASSPARCAASVRAADAAVRRFADAGGSEPPVARSRRSSTRTRHDTASTATWCATSARRRASRSHAARSTCPAAGSISAAALRTASSRPRLSARWRTPASPLSDPHAEDVAPGIHARPSRSVRRSAPWAATRRASAVRSTSSSRPAGVRSTRTWTKPR